MLLTDENKLQYQAVLNAKQNTLTAFFKFITAVTQEIKIAQLSHEEKAAVFSEISFLLQALQTCNTAHHTNTDFKALYQTLDRSYALGQHVNDYEAHKQAIWDACQHQTTVEGASRRQDNRKMFAATASVVTPLTMFLLPLPPIQLTALTLAFTWSAFMALQAFRGASTQEAHDRVNCSAFGMHALNEQIASCKQGFFSQLESAAGPGVSLFESGCFVS
jgi:hypothetical protein